MSFCWAAAGSLPHTDTDYIKPRAPPPCTCRMPARAVPLGLKNHGLTCSANAVQQCILHAPGFAIRLLAARNGAGAVPCSVDALLFAVLGEARTGRAASALGGRLVEHVYTMERAADAEQGDIDEFFMRCLETSASEGGELAACFGAPYFHRTTCGACTEEQSGSRVEFTSFRIACEWTDDLDATGLQDLVYATLEANLRSERCMRTNAPPAPRTLWRPQRVTTDTSAVRSRSILRFFCSAVATTTPPCPHTSTRDTLISARDSRCGKPRQRVHKNASTTSMYNCLPCPRHGGSLPGLRQARRHTVFSGVCRVYAPLTTRTLSAGGVTRTLPAGVCHANPACGQRHANSACG